MKISAQHIQMFVAGALALAGFHSLVWAPYYFIISKDLIFTVGSLLSGLALWIGIAMLTGSERALFWVRIYLLLSILSAMTSICLCVFPILPKPLHISLWLAASDLATPVILMWLLVWSHSQKYQQTPSTAPEPTSR